MNYTFYKTTTIAALACLNFQMANANPYCVLKENQPGRTCERLIGSDDNETQKLCAALTPEVKNLTRGAYTCSFFRPTGRSHGVPCVVLTTNDPNASPACSNVSAESCAQYPYCELANY